MLWVITCKTSPDMDAAREQAMSAHLEYMKAQNEILVLTGSTRSDDGKVLIGSLLIVNVNSRAQAQAFSDGDPYTQAGVFSSIVITRLNKGRWNPAAAENA